jgi:hypothetical protein
MRTLAIAVVVVGLGASAAWAKLLGLSIVRNDRTSLDRFRTCRSQAASTGKNGGQARLPFDAGFSRKHSGSQSA